VTTNPFQLGYLVENLDAAMAHWTDGLGAGPFFVLPPREFHDLTVDGLASEDCRVIEVVALGHLGNIQIELIVPGPAPSTYTRFHAAGLGGLHHIGMMSDDFVADRARALSRGYLPDMEARTSLSRIAYLRPQDAANSIIELIEANPRAEAVFAQVRDAARGWDGRDPVRTL
jgi:hypothetical protein